MLSIWPAKRACRVVLLLTS